MKNTARAERASSTIVSTSTPRPPTFESLPARVYFASTYYSIDGSGNNLSHADWGATGTDLIRYAAAQYADGISTPAGTTRAGARAVSNAVAPETSEATNDRQLSEFIWIFGQFVDHDMDLTLTGTDSFNIAVPAGDPSFDPAGTGTATMSLKRSAFVSGTGTSRANPRQQANTVTSFIDASMVYGSDAATASSLRTFAGGKLKTSDGNLLPLGATGFFQAGDIRVNENIALTSMQTIWMREHNTTATNLARRNPSWSDEKLYQEARKWVVAELQAVTYNEFLPALLGQNALSAYRGYRANVDPSIANEFSTAAFRFGHSTLGDDIDFLDGNGNDLREAISLNEAQFNPGVVEEWGVEPVLKYGASSQPREIDTQITDQLRNFLFTSPGNGGFDLAALNIQRGRDHGLADYNTTRASLGLRKVTSFGQITSDPALAQQLQSVYGSVNNVDLWVGVLAENHAAGGSVGQTAKAIISDQFRRLRDGDRLYFENVFSGRDLSTLRSTTLSSVISRNSTLQNIQADVFFFDVDLVGKVSVDGNRNGKIDPGDPAFANRRINLLDATGTVLGSVNTDRDGRYRFENVDALGTFTIQAAGGTALATVTRGGTVATNILVPPAPMPPPPPVQKLAGVAAEIAGPASGTRLEATALDDPFSQTAIV